MTRKDLLMNDDYWKTHLEILTETNAKQEVVIDKVLSMKNELIDLLDKNNKDCLNYAKSELAEIERPKMDKTATPYNRAATHILRKVIKILER